MTVISTPGSTPGSTQGSTQGQTMEVQRLAGRIGALIGGIDLNTSLSGEQVGHIRQALLANKVVFFRGQNLDSEGQLSFAARFGPLTIAHPTLESAKDEPNLFELDSLEGARANYWHTDVTFTDRPPTASVLRAVLIPPVGGDTIWANTVTAYSDLPESLRALAASLRAIHTNDHDYGRKLRRETGAPSARRADRFTSKLFETEHPVVRVHPETSERSLLLGGFARQIVGLTSAESADLIRTMQQYVTRPENTVRWRWQAGDVAMWDNRATQHYGVHDYGDEHRVVHRVTVAGEVPVGVDGRPSIAKVGDASYYSPVG